MLVEPIATQAIEPFSNQSELDAILLDCFDLTSLAGRHSAVLAIFFHRQLIIEPDAQLSRFSGCDLNGAALYHAG
jgi:hypothetical protein